MLRLTIHLFLLILFYITLIDGIEACKPKPHFNLNTVGWEPLETPSNTQGRQKGIFSSLPTF